MAGLLPPAPTGVNVEGAEQYIIPVGVADRELTGITWTVDSGWYWLIQSLFVTAPEFDSSTPGTTPHVLASDQDSGPLFDAVGMFDESDESPAWWLAAPGLAPAASGLQGGGISLPAVWLPPSATILFYLTTGLGAPAQGDFQEHTLIVTRAQYTGVSAGAQDELPLPTPLVP